MNKLHNKSSRVIELIHTNQNYSFETSTYLQILNITKEKTEQKLAEIIPHPTRSKRGLINAAGSIFKAVTGNLDASDGERYETLIKQLQLKQQKLSSNIISQNSICLKLIDKFNSTVQKINHNERLLQSKLKQVAFIVESHPYKENVMFIKDVLNQLINLYEITNSMLQDLENSLAFAKLQILHPSIIKLSDLYRELVNMKNQLRPEQLTFPVTLENIQIFEKIIKVDCYLFNNKITYILHVPIMKPETFQLFHLYSIPFLVDNQFRTIIPKNKYLLKNDLHYTFKDDPCQETISGNFLCTQSIVKNIKEDTPCEIQILQSVKMTNCSQIGLSVLQPIIEQLAESNEWVIVLPEKSTASLKCSEQDEFQKLFGSYLLQLPQNCTISFGNRKIINKQEFKTVHQPVLLPDLDVDVPNPVGKSITIDLEEVDLDDLQKLKTSLVRSSFIEDQSISMSPSLWTIIIYGMISLSIFYIVYYQVVRKWYYPRRQNPEVELQDVQLPR